MALARYKETTKQAIRDAVLLADTAKTCVMVANQVGKGCEGVRRVLGKLFDQGVIGKEYGHDSLGHYAVLYFKPGQAIVAPPGMTFTPKEDRRNGGRTVPFVVERRATVPAVQLGMHRDPLHEALFGTLEQQRKAEAARAAA